MKDICIYKHGTLKAGVADTPENRLLPDNYDVLPDMNKIGKFGKTSWDSFSYALLMGHNVWLHLESVQRANREFDNGSRPKMMWDTNGSHEKFEDIVEAIFATADRAEADAIIEKYDRYWMDVVGTRGFKGKKAKNSRTLFNNLFEAVDNEPEDSVQLEQALDTLVAIQQDLGLYD
jgi:hypothetical protein